jgi:hypothetical protein
LDNRITKFSFLPYRAEGDNIILLKLACTSRGSTIRGALEGKKPGSKEAGTGLSKTRKTTDET